MPETTFQVRWPDGTSDRCWSPSLVVREHLEAGASYDVVDFVDRTRTALAIGSERVRERWGAPCAAAARQQHAIEQRASAFAATERVVVERL